MLYSSVTLYLGRRTYAMATYAQSVPLLCARVLSCVIVLGGIHVYNTANVCIQNCKCTYTTLQMYVYNTANVYVLCGIHIHLQCCIHYIYICSVVYTVWYTYTFAVLYSSVTLYIDIHMQCMQSPSRCFVPECCIVLWFHVLLIYICSVVW